MLGNDPYRQPLADVLPNGCRESAMTCAFGISQSALLERSLANAASPRPVGVPGRPVESKVSSQTRHVLPTNTCVNKLTAADITAGPDVEVLALAPADSILPKDWARVDGEPVELRQPLRCRARLGLSAALPAGLRLRWLFRTAGRAGPEPAETRNLERRRQPEEPASDASRPPGKIRCVVRRPGRRATFAADNSVRPPPSIGGRQWPAVQPTLSAGDLWNWTVLSPIPSTRRPWPLGQEKAVFGSA